MAEGFDFGLPQYGLTSTGGSGFANLRSGFFGASGRAGVPYPSPFFDGAHTYLPSSQKKLFRWCRYYFFTNPLVNAVVYKMASYPITDLVFESPHAAVAGKYKYLKDQVLKFRSFQVETGLDYQCYGNSFTSINYPFVKFLQCNHCKVMKPAKKLRPHYKWRELKYRLTCPSCRRIGNAKPIDVWQRSPYKLGLVRWDPERISIDVNEETGSCRYYYQMSPRTRSQLVIGRNHIQEDVPNVFVEAAQKKMGLRFAPGQLFHMRRPSISGNGNDKGWGLSRILPVLKDSYYLQILKKGQEAIAREHIVPLRMLFPQPGSGTSDPYTTVPLAGWKGQMEEEIERWRRDPNYIPILPLPVGHQVVGGQGRAMILHQEHRVWAEHIVAGMHVPQEFIFGGLGYSGTQVSMRNLENEFINYRADIQGLTDWVFDSIGAWLGWPKVTKKFRRFKMADDLQRTMIYFQANQAGKVSDHTFLRELNEDYEHERILLGSEARAQSENQRRAQVAAAVGQGEAQQVMQLYMQASQADMVGGAPGPQPNQPQLPSPGGGEGGGGAVEGPAGAKLYPENGNSSPTTGIPGDASSQLTAHPETGMDVHYVAKRVANELRKQLKTKPPDAYATMQKMKATQPHFYSLVLQIMQGTKETRDPLDAQQSPLPSKKPPRRDPGRAIV